VRFVGGKAIEARDQLSKFSFTAALENTGIVSKKQANQIMRDADALLILNEERLARYLPGKLYEYLAAGSPILCIGDSGEIADLIRQFGSGMVLQWDSDTDLERALDLLIERKFSCTKQEELNTWLSDHTRQRMATEIMEKINNC